MISRHGAVASRRTARSLARTVGRRRWEAGLSCVCACVRAPLTASDNEQTSVENGEAFHAPPGWSRLQHTRGPAAIIPGPSSSMPPADESWGPRLEFFVSSRPGVFEDGPLPGEGGGCCSWLEMGGCIASS